MGGADRVDAGAQVKQIDAVYLEDPRRSLVLEAQQHATLALLEQRSDLQANAFSVGCWHASVRRKASLQPVCNRSAPRWTS